MYNIHKIKSIIEGPNFVKFCRLNMNYFIKSRKINPKDIIYYQLNKKGLSTKMEILNFNKINYVEDVSSLALFKQRKKLNPGIFIYLMQESLKSFYS